MSVPYHTPFDKTDLANLGITDPWSFGIADRTHWSDMDPLAHVNNAAYLSWFENVRLAWLSARKLSYFGPGQPKFVIRQVGIDYLGEMHMNEDYVVTSRVRDYRRTSFTMDYAVYALRDGQPVLCTTSHAVLVLLAPEGGKMALTPDLITILTKQDGAISAV